MHPLEIPAFGDVVASRDGGAVGGIGLLLATGADQEIGADRAPEVIRLERERLDERQADRRSLDLATATARLSATTELKATSRSWS